MTSLHIQKIKQAYSIAERKILNNSSILCGLYKRNMAISAEDLEYVRSERANEMIAL